MKTPVLIAIIATALQVVASFYYLLINFNVIEYGRNSKEISDLMQVFFSLSGVGLLIFFIMLYDKESKK